MQIALIGFGKSGKTTVFNALTGADAEVSAYASGKAQTHRAVVQVPDERLDRLGELHQSKKVVHATIEYVDPVGIRREQAGHGTSLGDDMLHAIGAADALAAVIRNFDDDSGVPRDPEGDFEAIQLELTLSDLAKVDNRLERIETQAKRVGADERHALETEAALLKRLKEALEAGVPISAVKCAPDEERALRAFQFLTAKPLLGVVNTAEGDSGEAVVSRLKERGAASKIPEAARPSFLALCGQTEMEIAQLDPKERAAFLEEYGIAEAGALRMIRLSYEALGVISFLTARATEAHAWTIRRGTPVVEAAGVVHSDMERGFIRAQVVHWEDLERDGDMAEAKKHGHLRLEGREYIVQDGDVIEILFNV